MNKLLFITLLSALSLYFFGCSNTESLIDTPKAHEFFKIAEKTDQKIQAELQKMANKPGISKVIGLQNCGNTCYMNSLLQSLIHSELGRFTEVPFQDITFAKNKDREKTLFKVFYDLTTDYRTTALPSISTESISLARSEFMPTLILGEQADANEYLNYFFARIGSELSVLERPLENYQASPKEIANFPFEYYWIKAGRIQEYSIVQELFGGFLQSTLNKTDGSKTISYDFFTTLALAFPKGAEASEGITLEKLLAHFSAEEELPDSAGNKSQQLRIHKAPKTLIIQLKRFRFEKETDVEPTKITTRVEYPAKLKLTTVADGDITFDLFSVVIHGGNLSGGHYTAQVKASTNNWFYASDDTVNPSTETAALGQHEGVYMLFYLRTN